jgi:C1A family cysteine protease
MTDDSIRRRSNKWYGCRRDTRDARDEDHKFKAPGRLKLPPVVDLRPNMPPIMNQGELGSCTANGITAALRYLLIKDKKPDLELSRLQLYYDERYIEDTINEDAGAEIRDGIKSAFKLGVGDEDLWPYQIHRFKEKPPEAVYLSALNYQGLEYSRVNVGIISLKSALALGYPVVIGISLYDSFENDDVAKTGILPMPNLDKEGLIGGHCMIVVGYGIHPGYFTVQNSWGDDWGDKGFVHIPEQYLGSELYGSDYWVIKAIG